MWGESKQNETIHIVSVESEPRTMVLKVTESLLTALRNLRYAKESRRLWVDQLCINQGDTEERGAQVSIMGEIYNKATCTVVWLGVQSKDAKLMNDMYNEFSTSLCYAEDSRGVRMLDVRP